MAAGMATEALKAVKVSWLWSDVYKGLEIAFGEDPDNVARAKRIWLGWTTRSFKRRGW